MSYNEYDDDLIDTCTEWLSERNAAYLAKEDRIVYYHSDTLRKTDERWHKLSPAQVLRIVKTTKLDKKLQPLLRLHHLISAFQEIGQIYEYGITSVFEVGEHIYNYSNHETLPRDALFMEALAEELYSRKFHSILLYDIYEMYATIGSRLGIKKIVLAVKNTYLHRYFPPYGYVIRSGTNRITVKGAKRVALLMPGKTAKSVTPINAIDKNYIITRVVDRYS